jgi:L-ascorbate metabolism protein UlaG (beta-lactamase superfamily)
MNKQFGICHQRKVTRRDFAKGALSAAAIAAAGRLAAQSHGPTGDAELDLRQAEIDAVTPKDFAEYCAPGLALGADALKRAVSRLPALGRLEAAFDKVFREAKETVVTDVNRPAVWYLYNMGLVVKTPKTMFSIDLHHRRAEEFAPLLDFALITHNHRDHYTERFKDAMDGGERKTVVNNFFDNYGAKKDGGYTREKSKTFNFGDVTVITGLCDHNSYLVDYTTPFEVHIGDFTLYHSGDCGNHAKLSPTRQPDLWVLHPFCGMNAAKGAEEAVHPKKAVIAHLQELGHEKDRWRWTYRDGLRAKKKLEDAGFPAIMPLWGDRL